MKADSEDMMLPDAALSGFYHPTIFFLLPDTEFLQVLQYAMSYPCLRAESPVYFPAMFRLSECGKETRRNFYIFPLPCKNLLREKSFCFWQMTYYEIVPPFLKSHLSMAYKTGRTVCYNRFC